MSDTPALHDVVGKALFDKAEHLDPSPTEQTWEAQTEWEKDYWRTLASYGLAESRLENKIADLQRENAALREALGYLGKVDGIANIVKHARKKFCSTK